MTLSESTYRRFGMNNRKKNNSSNQLDRTAEERVIQILGDPHHATKFATNSISTAKYNAWTFIPKFLFEQFRRYANLFFLFISLLQQIPDVSPTGRYTTAGPLVLILSVSAIKELVEDFKRHRADDQVNNSATEVLRDGEWKDVRWQDVHVGDVVKVMNSHSFPADLVLVCSSEPQGLCYIETSNLDGETNLKLRQGLPETAQMGEVGPDGTHSHKELANRLFHDLNSAHMECEGPNRHVYDFNGNVMLTSEGSNQLKRPLGPEQVLLRGAALKNTRWVVGVAVYTGHETKLMMNSTATPLKRSHVETVVNFQIILLFGLLVFIAFVSSVAQGIWGASNTGLDYLPPQEKHIGTVLLDFLTFIILYNNLVPISLIVTIEVVKYVQAIFIGWDRDMYDERSGTPALARTSNLNEELGQVKYIFTDKTGTLTRNHMVFRSCSIAGRVFNDEVPQMLGIPDEEKETLPFTCKNLYDALRDKDYDLHSSVYEFFEILSVCHTVVAENNEDGDPDEPIYNASSPDEAALVKAAKEMGVVFKSRSPGAVTIEFCGEEIVYQILNILEFTSARKRQSVVVKTPDGQFKLYCKGADSVIFERLAPHQKMGDKTLEQLSDFATRGLRTLCLASAVIDEEFYSDWANTFYKASTALQDRETKVSEAAELIERNLHLVGATAIEDRLQDGVPECIATLLKADIKIWVLTGDKQETAINIGYSCNVINMNMTMRVLNETNKEDTRERLLSIKEELPADRLHMDNDIAFVIDGRTLLYALSDDLVSLFLDVGRSCRTVICCRVSPSQKAEIVDVVKTHVADSITLAIGDGANDVGMIQRAHVGVGISGVEGLQAVCAADYAISQFRFLQKLLLVHGSWNYARLCNLILYSFYKNITLYFIEFWFSMVSGYSGQIVFERWTIALYNVIFTVTPPFALGLFDRYCSKKTLMKFPQLYKDSQHGTLFSTRIFWQWIGNAIYHSCVLFWMTYGALRQDIAFEDGKIGDYLFMGNMVYTYVVITVCIRSGLETNSWTLITHASIWGSILSWFIFIAIYSRIWPWIDVGAVMLGMAEMVFNCSIFWFGLILIPSFALSSDVVIKVIQRTCFKTLREAVQEFEHSGRDPTQIIVSSARSTIKETTRLLRRAFGRESEPGTSSAASITLKGIQHNTDQQRGYAFSQEESGHISQTELVSKYEVSRSPEKKHRVLLNTIPENIDPDPIGQGVGYQQVSVDLHDQRDRSDSMDDRDGRTKSG